MMELLPGVLSAFWLGLLTSISPCPLATNIAAISFVGRRIGSPSGVFLSGLLYTLGRMLSYTALGVMLVASLLSAPTLSRFLQTHMNTALGPLLILAGMVLSGLITLPAGRGIGSGERLQKRVEGLGLGGALLLGVVFALSFCPVSAALFFGSLIPLALHYESGVALPSVYGAATGLPVLILALGLSFGAQRVGEAYRSIRAFERWARVVTGAAFILVGVYFSLVYIFQVRF
ncbi:MAG: aromatic aminobenezylarsenical efflux permease ArsG family transporter [Bacteroidota bacterium]